MNSKGEKKLYADNRVLWFVEGGMRKWIICFHWKTR